MDEGEKGERSVLLLEPNSTSSTSESSESKSENFFLSFAGTGSAFLAAAAAEGGKPVATGGKGTTVGAGGDATSFDDGGRAKRSSMSLVELAAAVPLERGFLVGGVRVLTETLARS